MRLTLLLLPLALLFAGCNSTEKEPTFGTTDGGEQATVGNGSYVPYPGEGSRSGEQSE